MPVGSDVVDSCIVMPLPEVSKTALPVMSNRRMVTKSLLSFSMLMTSLAGLGYTCIILSVVYTVQFVGVESEVAPCLCFAGVGSVVVKVVVFFVDFTHDVIGVEERGAQIVIPVLKQLGEAA